MAAYVGFLRFPFVGFLALLFAGSIAAQPESTRIYNTVKEKLANGQQVVGGTVTSSGWGNDYRQTANENIMVVAMIESPSGVDIADEIAAVSGVDIVMAASTDLGSFSGLRQGDPAYERMVDEIVRATNEAGLYLGGPQAWMDRGGFDFFQAPDDTFFIRLGAQSSLSSQPAGVAPTEGAED